MNPDAGKAATAPKWVQVQLITSDNDYGMGASDDIQGHSIVNPATSSNGGLLAVGAFDYRNSNDSKPELMDYSSKGPVYNQGANILTTYPTRVKPDVVAISGAATYTKWSNCGKKKPVSKCGDDLYFTGTSAATAHTGGMAALVVNWFEKLGISYTATDVADFLRKSGQQKTSLATPNNNWGDGFIVLPCPPKLVEKALPYSIEGEWESLDCESTRRSGRYVDFYTFKLSSTTKVQIDLESDDADAYLYLIEGVFSGGDEWETKNDDVVSGNTDSRIIETLDAGVYTVAVTTYKSGDTGDYNFGISVGSELPAIPKPSASLSPIPNTRSFLNDGAWHRFTVTATVPITVIANPGSTGRIVEVSSSSSAGNYCPAENDDPVNRVDGNYVYLAGCLAGVGVVRLVEKDNTANVLASYGVPVKAKLAPVAPVPTVCKPVRSFNVYRASQTKANISWANPTDSIASTGKRIEIRKYVGSGTNFVHERYIDETATATSARHLGLDRGGYYSYRMLNKCSGNKESTWTSWWLIGPYQGVSGASGDEEPQPTPGVPEPYVKNPADEQPPPPLNP